MRNLTVGGCTLLSRRLTACGGSSKLAANQILNANDANIIAPFQARGNVGGASGFGIEHMDVSLLALCHNGF